MRLLPNSFSVIFGLDPEIQKYSIVEAGFPGQAGE
jgi:hypothetical protein